MVSKATKVRLGVFLVVGFMLILIFAAAVAGNKLRQNWDEYYIVFDDYPVSGLQLGGTVNYQGIKVGRVKDIRIDPNDVKKVLLTIQVEPGTPIKEDTEAVLSLVGITGLKAVEIKGGTNEAMTLKPLSYIKAGSTMIDNISDRAVSIVDKLDLIAENINEMTNAENRENIAKILEETGLILYETRQNVSSTMAALTRVANNTAVLTDELSQNIETLTTSVTGNIDEVAGVTIESVKEITETLNAELLNITQTLNTTVEELTGQATALLDDSRFHLNNIGANANTLVVESTEQIVLLSSNLNRSLDKINSVFYSEEFDSIVNNLNILAKQLNEANLGELASDLGVTVKRTGTLINNLNRTVQRSRDDLAETLENLRDATDNLNEFSRQLADNPAILIRGN
ncbi:MAG: MCE family protein [Candidatus Cloacimonetes bacterium]|jgi:phospholipid/cholesterol/gamma-HCH transport system substrate-binding protein|nr:MCE family protein [Candidatus Cloacimonadota bacterium]